MQESGFNFTGAINTRNQIAAGGYAYDAAGNLIADPPTGTAFTYDAENHLISYKEQKAIDDRGGKNNLDNKRNEVNPKKMKDLEKKYRPDKSNE